MGDFHDFWRRFRRNTLAVLGLMVVIGLVVTATFTFLFIPYEWVIAQDFPKTLQPPSWQHPMGTDQLGRDVFMRVLWASQTSLLVGFTVVLIGMTVGTAFGLLAGYLGGWVDSVISRCSDVMLAFPFLLMAIAVTAALGPSLTNLIIALGVATFPSYTRLVRGSVLAIKAEQFVDAAQSIGVGKVRIMLRHILPNLMGTLLVYGTLRVSTAILAESGLSFLGLGAQPPEPTWGNMLSDAREYLLFYRWLPLFPGMAILVTVLGFNLLGDGLRDILDPRLKDV